MPLLVVDNQLTTNEQKGKHLEENPSHASLHFSEDRARDTQNRSLSRLVVAIEWELYLNLETEVSPLELSAHAKRSLVVGTVPFTRLDLERVTLTVGASFGVYIAGILRRRCHLRALPRWLSHKTSQDQYSAADHSEPFNNAE